MTAVGGEKLCEESDVVAHYCVILGRDPESAAVVDEAKRQPLTRFVARDSRPESSRNP